MQAIDLSGQKKRDAAFIRYAHQRDMGRVCILPSILAVRDARYPLSVLQDVEWGELYDLQADPGRAGACRPQSHAYGVGIAGRKGRGT